MNRRHATAAVAATATLAALGASALVPSPASGAAGAAGAAKPGTTSLAEVLAADGQGKLDRRWGDVDIAEKAILAVLEAKPKSDLGLITQGRKRATAFVPSDRAFRRLVEDLTGREPKTEAKTFRAVAAAAGDIDTLETILLYHVVAGRTLTAKRVVATEGNHVRTAAGLPIEVDVRRGNVRLLDRDPDDRNAKVRVADINKGNKQVAHVISRVLRPIDL